MDSPAERPVEAAQLQDLCRRAAAGSEDAIKLLLWQYHPRLLGFLRRKVGVDWAGKIDPEDILQEGYIKVCGAIKEFKLEGEDSFYRWATQILDHVFIDQVRALRRKKRSVAREAASGGDGMGAQSGGGSRRHVLLDQLIADSVTPSRIMRREEALAAMMACIATLPDDYRVVVLRHFLNEEPLKTIAADLGRSEDALRRLAGRAVEKLGECLGNASHFLSMR